MADHLWVTDKRDPTNSVVYSVDDSGSILGIGTTIEVGETLVDALVRTQYLPAGTTSTHIETKPAKFPSGCYFERIHRPFLHGVECPIPIDDAALSSSARQLSSLKSRLELIFNVAEPTPDNIDVYGHEIRNLILVACTEVEAQSKGVLLANSVTPIRNQFGMRDYHKLLPVLQLEKYAVRLPVHTSLGPIEPFANWNPHKMPSGQWNTGLTWYDAYNTIKHDREHQFHQSTLKHAIDSVVAIAILLAAQYGLHNIPQVAESFVFDKTPSLWPRDEMLRTLGPTMARADYPFP